MHDVNLIAAGCLQSQIQRVRHIFGPHVGAQLPRNDIAAVIVQDCTEIKPAPAQNLQVAALYERSVSAGIGYYARSTDLVGVGLNWAEAKGIPGSQTTMEMFYRFPISPGLQITPSLQYIDNPLLNPGQSSITILGLRARVVF